MCLPLFQTLVNLCSRSPCKNKGTCIQDKAESRCLCPSGWAGAYCDVPSVSCEVAASRRGELCPPETQGSVHEVLTNEQHCRARVVIVGGEGRADRNEWARLWRKGLKWEVKGRGASLEILKRNVLDVEGRHVPLSALVYFLTYLFLIEG